MKQINSSIYKLLFAGWLGVVLFWLAGVPDGSYQTIDVNISIWFTGVLKAHPDVAQVLYNFNSISEAYTNVLVMFACLVFGMLRLKSQDRTAGFFKILAAFIWVEFWIIFVINPFISQFLTLDVNMVPEVSSWINETQRVVGNETALISRHVFTMLFLAWYNVDERVDFLSKILIYSCAIIFSFAPILNAHHWMSDFLFSGWLAYSFVHLSALCKLEYWLQNWFSNNK